MQSLYLTNVLVHPDEYYQGTQVAYDIVYGGVKLPWEWQEQYRLRNILYPAYLALPLKFLEATGLDFTQAVIYSPYFANLVLQIIGDYYFWKLGKKVIGKEATRVAFILSLTNCFMQELELRCFTNSIEKICNIIAFYFFLKIDGSMSFSVVLFTLLLTISFIMRNTSPVGWIPLLLIQVSQNYKTLVWYVVTFFTAFVPLFTFAIYLDSRYYQVLNDK